jgi:prevent-host-death family protein
MKSGISAADANRNFSKLLRDVRDGGTYVITAHGKPVAKMIPFTAHDAVAAAAKSSLLKRLRSQRGTDIGRWTRDELYDN